MKALVIAIALLFITTTLYSQKVLNTVAGRDYRVYGFVQNYYRVDKVDTFLIITDDYNEQQPALSSLIYSLKSLQFVKRSDPIIFDLEDYKYLGFSKLNGGEFWFDKKYTEFGPEYNLTLKYSINNTNLSRTRQIIYFKDNEYEVDIYNVESQCIIDDIIYFKSKNKLNVADTNKFITAWNLTNNSRTQVLDDYINNTKEIPLKKFNYRYYMEMNGKIYDMKNNKSTDIFDLVLNPDSNFYQLTVLQNNNFNYLENINQYIAFYESVTWSKNRTGFGTCILDSNLKAKKYIYSNSIIRSDSYNENLRELYYLDSLDNLIVFDLTNHSEKYKIKLSNYIESKTVKYIHNVSYLKEDLLLLTMSNPSGFGTIHSSFLFDLKEKIVLNNIYNDNYFIHNISISENNEYIATISKNRQLFVYDSLLKEIANIDFKTNEDIFSKDTIIYNSELHFDDNDNLLITASNLFDKNIIINLNDKKITNKFNQSDSSFTACWLKSDVLMNHNHNIIHYYKKSANNYQLSDSLVLKSNYQIIKIAVKSQNSIVALVKDIDTKYDVIIEWDLITKLTTEKNINTNLFKINKFDMINSKVKITKNQDMFYQDYNGIFVSLNVNNYDIQNFRIAEEVSSYIPQYNYSHLTNNGEYVIFSNSHFELHKESDSQLRIMNLKTMSNLNGLKKIDFINEESFRHFGSDMYFTTRQFCNYAQFNYNPNKIICGSFDGTLSILEFDNLLTSVEAENIISLDKTSKVFVTGNSYEFRNNEQYPVKLSIYNFNGISVSELILESSELIDLAKYSNNEKLLLIKRENSLTGEVIDNKILIFQ